ncbi:hypothetical protein pb186bvf_012310 [Paramecium bursaria]
MIIKLYLIAIKVISVEILLQIQQNVKHLRRIIKFSVNQRYQFEQHWKYQQQEQIFLNQIQWKNIKLHYIFQIFQLAYKMIKKYESNNMNQYKQLFCGILIGGTLVKILSHIFKTKKQSINRPIMPKEEHLKEQLVRNYQFFGEQGQQKIDNSYILIFGVGGVGSHVLSAIARSGCRKIAIVDFDRVSLSSLNRHAFATRKHTGISKVEVFQQFISDLNPHIELIVYEKYVVPDNVQEFFKEKPDYVIDCIDNMDAKVAIIKYCLQNNIKIIVSSGAGMKADPTRIQIRDISESQNCELARALRMRLKAFKIKKGFKIVFSQELAERQLLPLKDHQVDKIEEYRQFDNYRLRIVPVFSCMPALIAYSISSYVLCDIAEQLYETYNIEDVKHTHYTRFYNQLLNQGSKLKKEVIVDIEDIYIVVREVYQFKCLITDKKSYQLEMVVWDATKDITINNLTLLYGKAAEIHKNIKDIQEINKIYKPEILQRKMVYDQAILDFVAKNKRVYK